MGKMAKAKVSMTIDSHVFTAFKDYCKDNGMKVSTKVEQLMRESTKNITLHKYIKQ
ncbi:hypothetical protein HYU15_01150 [Candidatus Woesearchaeota archaeon]|nr:hypothetical protein [Candidatus Woesearchaeota archaeon]